MQSQRGEFPSAPRRPPRHPRPLPIGEAEGTSALQEPLLQRHRYRLRASPSPSPRRAPPWRRRRRGVWAPSAMESAPPCLRTPPCHRSDPTERRAAEIFSTWPPTAGAPSSAFRYSNPVREAPELRSTTREEV